MHVWSYCSECFVNKRFEKWDSRSRCQVLEQKDWELSLEIKSNEYISVFPLIFQFPLNFLCSFKSANKPYLQCTSTAIFFFSSLYLIISLITDLLSVISYQNIYIFIKWKHIKYHAERSKYPFHPIVSKKIHPGLKFHSRVNFTSPTCNIPLRALPWTQFNL